MYKGIKIDNKEIKISLLADDINLLLSDHTSIEITINTLSHFYNCAGLKINVEKTQAKYIGSLVSYDHFPHGLSWIKAPLETLGIFIILNDDLNYKLNFQQRI